MFIRLLSDIHLELSSNFNTLMSRLIPSVPLASTIPLLSEKSLSTSTVLVLAGDIGDPSTEVYKVFISEMSKCYDKVFIVTGNHEYYQHDAAMDEVNKLVTLTAESLPNVHFLNQKAVVFNRVRFVGCTLWTKSDFRLSKYMNDYNCIPSMTPSLCEELHNSDVAWLSKELNSISCDEVITNTMDIKSPRAFDKTVVITHHLPSYKLIANKYKGDPMNSFFATNLEELVEKADIWCCGHSHTAKQVKIGKCRCYLNPVGYSKEYTGFKSFIEIAVK